MEKIVYFFLQMKTVSVALVLCLNVGVDPPDVVKTSPCARLECWIGRYLGPSIPRKLYHYSFVVMASPMFNNSMLNPSLDPLTTSSQKALEAIGANLQRQYERWQPRARYKQSLDPTVEEVKKLCTSLRRNAKVSLSVDLLR